jgi:Ca2+/H+ antiporter
MKPSFATLARIMITPTMSASIDASATARAASPLAAISGRIVAAIIGPSEESGPSTRIRDGPNTA